MNIDFRSEAIDSFKSVREVTEFIRILTDDSRMKSYEKCWVVSVEYEDDTSFPTMITCMITFQCWKKNERGFGTKYTFTNYRAKSFSCQNCNIEKVNTDESVPS